MAVGCQMGTDQIIDAYRTRDSDYIAGLLTSGENVVREIDGEFGRNPPYFPGQYFINLYFNQLTRDE